MRKITKYILTMAFIVLCGAELSVSAQQISTEAENSFSVNGVTMQFPADWQTNAEGKTNFMSVHSPDKGLKMFIYGTASDNFDTIQAQILDKYLANYKNVQKVSQDDFERNGLGMRKITFTGDLENSSFNIVAQLAFRLGDAPVKSVLLIGALRKNLEQTSNATFAQIFENEKAFSPKTTPAKTVASQSVSVVVNKPAQNTGNVCPGTATGLTADEINEILSIHNQLRAEVGTAPLKWSCKLTEFAQNWANKDVFDHSTDADQKPFFGDDYVGENLAIDAQSTIAVTNLLKRWSNEKPFWNNSAKSCAPGKECGHYTAMVWKTTTEVGCGINRKSNTMGERWKGQATYIICNYSPGGNNGDEAF